MRAALALLLACAAALASLPPSGRCSGLAKTSCAKYARCLWAKSNCQLAPSPAPSTSASPSSLQPTTAEPSPAPTKRPTTAAPTKCVVPPNGCAALGVSSCHRYSGCSWGLAGPCTAHCSASAAPTSKAPSTLSPPASLSPFAAASCVVPPAGCTSLGTSKTQCKLWSGCAFGSKCQNATCSQTTRLPSVAPVHTSQDNFSSQSQRPTNMPTSASPTIKPTPIPTRSPMPPLCSGPPLGAACSTIADLTLCAKYSGCIVQNNACASLPCNQFMCGVYDTVMKAAGLQAPGCLQGDEQACDQQRWRVFSALQLSSSCFATFVPSANGGATLQQAVPPVLEALPGDVVVDPELGSDVSGDGSWHNPVASIQVGLEITRTQGLSPKRLVLAKGTHRPAATIELSAEDSGLIVQGVPGAVISGSVLLGSGLKWVTQANGIMYADLPDELASRLDHLSLLFVNGQPAIRARYPNIPEYFATAFQSAGSVQAWAGRGQAPPLTQDIHHSLNLGNFQYNGFVMGYGGPCTGVFEPPNSYFCSTYEQAAGNCNYDIPGGVILSPPLASLLNIGAWGATPGGLFHAWQPQMWGLWSFDFSVAGTNSPTFKSTPAPTSYPTPALVAPSLISAPSSSPFQTASTLSPNTASPSPFSSSAVPTSRPVQNPTSQQPTLQPSTLLAHSTTGPASYSPTSSAYSSSTLTPSSSTTPQFKGRGLRNNVTSASLVTQHLFFTKGGFQEARGDCGNGGGNFFIENVFQLLDAPNEFFLKLSSSASVPSRLYFMPNGTKPNDAGVVLEMSSLRNIFSITGSSEGNPVVDVKIQGVKIEQTYPTFMDSHEVASSGDWTIHRGGAVFIENATDIRVTDCTFEYLGGNGVFVSGFARDVVVTRNVFYALGSSAMLAAGSNQFDSPTPWDYLTAPQSYPANVVFSFNMVSEIGLTFKQSAGAFVSISKNVTVSNNMIFNGARAGLIQNDGFGGGNTYRRNILFNLVRETTDHGPFNAWDRQRWIEPGNKLPSVVDNNLFIGSTLGPKGIDLDDGVQNWVSTNNVIVKGFHKFKGANIVATGNLILFPLQDIQKTSACLFLAPAIRYPANWLFSNNTCVSANGGGIPQYGFTGMLPQQAGPLCALSNLRTSLNTFYGFDPSQTFPNCNFQSINWSQWKTQGQDQGSSCIAKMPLDSTLVGMVQAALPWAVSATAAAAA